MGRDVQDARAANLLDGGLARCRSEPGLHSEEFPKCLALLEQLEPEGLVVTKRGKPVARVLPIPREPEQMIGSLKGEIKVMGDILSTGLDWKARAQP